MKRRRLILLVLDVADTIVAEYEIIHRAESRFQSDVYSYTSLKIEQILEQ